MASMFPVYDEKAWKRLLAAVEADTYFSVASTYAAYVPDSTVAMGTAQGTATSAGFLIFVAHDVPKNRVHLMYSYRSTL